MTIVCKLLRVFAIGSLIIAVMPVASVAGSRSRDSNRFVAPIVSKSRIVVQKPVKVSPTPRVSSTPPPSSPLITLHFDDSAVRQFLTMAKNHDTEDAHLESWLDLPANKHLIFIGGQENNLTRAQLKANALEAINGTATATSQPSSSMGCLRLDSIDLYNAMLTALEKSIPDRVAAIVARDTAYSPDTTKIDETVYFHLGGDWDAINYEGNVYINVRFWEEASVPSWDGLNMIVAHETMHSIQTEAYGNPQYDDTGQRAWVTALSKIQREGTARLVEYDADPGPYRVGTYGFLERAIDTETLRRFPVDIQLLGGLCDSCFPQFDVDRFEDEFSNGMNLGGAYYDVGHGIAKAIDDHLGREALIATVSGGPKDFYNDYIDLCRMNTDLPPLPDRVAQAIEAMPANVDDPAAVNGIP